MASIYRHGKGWRVQVYVNGVRESTVLPTKQQAAAWAVEREALLSGKKLPDKTFADAMERYAEEVSPAKDGGRWEIIRLTALGAHGIAKKRLSLLSGPDFAEWRDARKKQVSDATVLREMGLLRAVLEVARRDWGWITSNPMTDVRRPQPPPSRKRRVSPKEIEQITLACGVSERLESATAMQRTGLAFLFALETAMRSGEILAILPAHIHAKERWVHIPKSKNGDERDVPLSSRALEILQALPATDGPVFDVKDATRDALFREARSTTKLVDLHFHDSRAEAIWRLSKKFDVLELARVIGHRDINSLLIYYQTNAADLSARLD